jgi:hypothetical protein
MEKITLTINQLYTIYVAGFNHGMNEGFTPEHGTGEAFERLRKGQSPLNDSVSYFGKTFEQLSEENTK